MSHLHIPDGLIPLPWILAGIGLTALFVCVALFALRKRDRARVVPRIATLSALMLLAMGLPIPVLGYHLNLTVLTGMIAGPASPFWQVVRHWRSSLHYPRLQPSTGYEPLKNYSGSS